MGTIPGSEELRDTPIVDKGCCVLMANNEIVLDLLEAGEMERAKDGVAWLIWAAKAYGVKAVNPGGVAAWKWGKDAKVLSEPVPGYDKVTPAMIVASLARIVDELGLPHPLHLHCKNLGAPGNGATTLETMKVLEGTRAHMAHLPITRSPMANCCSGIHATSSRPGRSWSKKGTSAR